jgi:hypothetical protein
VGLVAVDVAASHAVVGSEGLPVSAVDETGRTVQPPQARGSRSYGRGSGVELGLGMGTATSLEFRLTGVAEQTAPPDRPLVTEEIGPVAVDPLFYASFLRAQAEPSWRDQTCVIGRPLGFGLGSVADAGVLNLGSPSPGPVFSKALLALDAGSAPDRVVSQSRSLAYLTPNGQGAFALVSEVRQTIAPVTLLKGLPGEVTVELLGEFLLRVTAGGTGGAAVEYGPAGNSSPSTPVLRLISGGQTTEFTLQQVFGEQGLTVAASPAVDLSVGAAPHHPTGGANAAAAAVVDVVKLRVLGPLPGGGVSAVDVRLGHMEARADVPPGGVPCPLPVRKMNAPAVVRAGEQFTFHISIPAEADALDGLSCDLVGIRAVDTVGAPGDLRFTLESASQRGVISGSIVTWEDAGDYHPGDPPVALEVDGRVEPGSVSGVLSDTLVATAGLARCTGGATAQPLIGLRTSAPEAVRGTFTLVGPRVSGASSSGPGDDGVSSRPIRLTLRE